MASPPSLRAPIEAVVRLLRHADELDDAARALRMDAKNLLTGMNALDLAEVACRTDGYDLATLQILAHGLPPRKRQP